MEEMKRVLKVNGKGLIYAWALDQKKDKTPSTYLKQGKTNPNREKESPSKSEVANTFNLPVHKNRTDFEHSDVLVPWKIKGEHNDGQPKETFHRYYHVFEEGELENLLLSVPGLVIEKSYYDQGNWCVIFRKES